MKLTKTKVVVLMVSMWAIACVAYAYYYIATMLALPEWPYDTYARNWQFQLMAFCIVRLPFLLAVLLLLILIALVLFKRWTSNVREN